MKTKATFICILVFILLASSINVDAANLSASSLAANEPWSLEYVDRDEGAGVGTHVSIAHHPKTGAAYISYYDAKNGDLWMAHESHLVRGIVPIIIGNVLWSIQPVTLASLVQLT